MLEGKKIAIIGGTGSLGHCLTKRFYKNNDIFVYSRDELKQWKMKSLYPNIKMVIGDVRDQSAVKRMLRVIRPDIVIMAAALKHVDVCEYNPQESINTNLLGIDNVLVSVEDLDLETTVLLVSTDKACSPVNVYGMCKAISERLVSERSTRKSKAKFLCVRYGNVINSRGSIIPLFMKQANDDKIDSFTITTKDMTRFFMTLDESVDLIHEAIEKGKSGDTWIPILRSGNILDLAEIFSERFGKPIKEIGIRPGEKIHESLINSVESMRAERYGEFYVLRPSIDDTRNNSRFTYTSADYLFSKNDLNMFLISNNVFDGINEL